MPLTIVTGPANAAKAGAVIDRLAEANSAGREPILVVPTSGDVDVYRRELAGRPDTVMGPRILRFDGLLTVMARRAGVTGRPLSPTQRELLVAQVAGRLPLTALAESAATPGFARAAARFLGEVTATGAQAGWAINALREWGVTQNREAYGRDLAALVGGYADALRALGRPDPEGFALRVTHLLQEEPARWGATPVFLYGFDDLTPIEQRVIEALGLAPVDAQVVLSLPAEPGRVALAAGARLVAELGQLGTVELLEADARFYAEGARAQLHAVERALFEGGAGAVLPVPPRAPEGDAVLLLEGGGERAELELVAAEIAARIDAGWRPDEIAVVARDMDVAAPAILEVLADFAIPATAPRRGVVTETSLGASLAALLRWAFLGGQATPADLVAFLRAPGVVTDPGLVDDLEALVRRGAITRPAAARDRWRTIVRGREDPLAAAQELADAASAGPADLLDAVESQAARLAALAEAPGARAGRPIGPDGRDTIQALAVVRRWLGELRELLPAGLVPAARALPGLLAELPVRLGADPGPGVVAVMDPLAIRARRVRGLFLVRMQDGTFPTTVRPDPFLDEDDRRELEGWRLPHVEDPVAAERHLFYSTISRPTELLGISWHLADDDTGKPRGRSPFVDDLDDVLAPGTPVRRRRLGAVTWEGIVPSAEGPAHRAALAAAAHEAPRREADVPPLAAPAVLAALRAHDTYSATALETLLDCPVKWFVERWLRGEDLDPAPEQMARGSLAHRVLEEVFRGLARPLTRETLPEARALLDRALEEHAAAFVLSADASRARSTVRRMQADLERYLAHAAADEAGYVPTYFELAFGERDSELAPVPIGDDLRLKGHVDRIDVEPESARSGAAGPRRAVIVDYKGASVPRQAHWLSDRKIQAAVYLHAMRVLLQLDVAGALYQPVRGKTLVARGAVRDDVEPGFPVHGDDRLDPEAFEALLREVLDLVRAAVAQVRTGALTPTPETCAYGGGGCSHPMICRRARPAAR